MKKIIILILAFAMIFSLNACSVKSEKEEKSNKSIVIEEYVSEAKLAFDPKDLGSIISKTDKVVLIENAKYIETRMSKNSSAPKRAFNIEKLKIIDKEVKNIDNLINNLEANKDSIKVFLHGGVITKAQWYESLNDELKDKSAGKKYVEKPVGNEAKKKMKVYNNEYAEFAGSKIYLLLANLDKETNSFYADAYTVFEYDKKSKSFYNPVSKLRFTLKDLLSKLK